VTRVTAALAAAVVAGLGAIGATLWVGAHVREDTVVARPYEEGLAQDADRRARADLGLATSIAGEPLEAGAGPLRFALADRAGRAVEGAAVTVEASRPETSRGTLAARARAEGGGRFAADLAFPAPGPWDVRFDVTLGERRVRLERRVAVLPACDLSAAPCARPLTGGGEVVLELSPRPLRAMCELGVRVVVREATATSTESAFGSSLSPRAAGGEGQGEGVVARDGASVSSTPSPRPSPPRSGGEGGLHPRSTPTSTSTPTPTPTSTPTSTPTPTSALAAAPDAVSVSFSMPGMEMGENRVALSPAGGGAWAGKAVLVRCPSGRGDWVVQVDVSPAGGPPRVARFALALPGERR
jgi:nitrogen fixation protein FixH